jgi:cytoskeletal protein CcmA (bactofilin family)
MERDTRDTRPDLSINGVGSAAGGEYRHVSIDGVCKVQADIASDSFRVNGHTTAKGSIRTGRFDCNGRLNVEGGLHVASARIDGMIRVDGPVSGEQITVHGMLNCGADCEAERFEMRGLFEIKGLLNAGAIEVRMHGRCEAREIGGEKIRIVKGAEGRWNRLLQWAIPKLGAHLEADLIEGDDIELEDTVAAVVRGNRVVIGKGCKIGKVEYRTELIQHPQAKVQDRIQA